MDFPSGFYKTWPECKAAFPAIHAVLLKTPTNGLASIQLLLKVSRYLVLTTQYPLAGPYITRLYNTAIEQLPEKQPERLAAVALSVRYLLALERNIEAEAQIRSAYEHAKEAYGLRSIHTFQCEYWLAFSLYRMGREAEATAMLQAAVIMANGYLSPEHSFMLRVRTLLSRLLQLSGQQQLSFNIIESVVTAQAKTLPPGDPAVLDAKQDYAFALVFQGKLTEAVASSKATLEDCKKYLTTEHVVSCMAAFTYANLAFMMSQYHALDYELPWACNGLKRILGPGHRDTQMLENFRSNMLSDIKVDIKTSPLFKRLQSGIGNQVPIPLADALIMLGQLGTQDFENGLKATGLERVWVSVAGWEYLSSNNAIPHLRDHEIVPSMVSFAQCLADLKRDREAEDQHWKALNMARAACGQHSIWALKAAVSLGSFLDKSLRRHPDAEKLLRNTLATYKTYFGENTEDTYNCMWRLAQCEIKTGKLRSAHAHFRDAINFYFRMGQYESESVLICGEGIAQVRIEKDRKKFERKRERNPDYQTAGASSTEAVALHAAAAAGFSTLPNVSLFDSTVFSHRPLSIPKVPRSLSAIFCSQCKKITLESLLRSRLGSRPAPNQADAQLMNRPGYKSLLLSYDCPIDSARSCRMCRLILGPLGDTKIPLSLTIHPICKDNSHRFSSITATASWKTEKGIQKQHNHIAAYALKPPGSQYTPSPLLEDPVSERTLVKIRHWIQECDECHSNCFVGLSESEIDENPLLPTRVIYVPPEGSEPRLIVSNGLRGRYLALSHCWGGQTHFMCTKKTLPDLCNAIPLENLSKTARDAIYVARKIGVSYLWIDSLCIVQDDKEDWLREAPRMGSVYEYAYVTLAATAAINGNEGLFAPMRHDDIVPLQYEDVWTKEQGDIYLVPDGIAFHEIMSGPLNVRGWVLQERLLSRRTLHFAATRVYWECQNSYQSEEREVPNTVSDSSNRGRRLRKALRHYQLGHGMDGDDDEDSDEETTSELVKPEDDADPGPGRTFGKDFDIQSTWRDIVTFYSSCGLTFTSDKLPALAGIMTKIQSRCKMDYYDGHWFSSTVDTIIGLLWAARGVQMVSPAEPRAASWSWASLDGSLEFLIDEVDAGRLSEQPNNLRIEKVVAAPFSQSTPPVNRVLRPFQHTLRCSGVIRHITRCVLGSHESSFESMNKGPYPRARYYHLGKSCTEDFEWYPKPIPAVDDPDSEARDVRLALEFYAKRYPLRAREKNLPDAFSSLALNGVDEPEEAPGLGWVAFDRADEEPEEFELVYVCTRGFLGRRRVPTLQYLALACLPCEGRDGMRCFRRVGVAQIHQKDWFEGIGVEEFTLV